MNPAALPIRLALRLGPIVRKPVTVAVARRALPLLRTRRPQARLRMIDRPFAFTLQRLAGLAEN